MIPIEAEFEELQTQKSNDPCSNTTTPLIQNDQNVCNLFGQHQVRRTGRGVHLQNACYECAIECTLRFFLFL